MNSLMEDKMSQGVALMAAENYDAAVSVFDEVIKNEPKTLEAYIHKGNALANKELYNDAIDCFKKSLMVDADFSESYFSIGSIYILMEDNIKAIEYFNKAEERGYKTAQMYLLQASIFWEANDYLQAIRCINKAISVEPLNGELRLFKIRIFLSNNDYNNALLALDEMEKLLPDAFEVYDLKSQILLGLGKKKEALSIIEKGCERFPKDANLAAIKLKALVDMDMTTEAKETLKQIKENGLYDGSLKEIALQEATLLLKDEKINEAVKVLISALGKLNNDQDILFVVMDIYGKTGKYEELLKYSSIMMSMDANDLYLATAKFFHATALNETGRKEESKKEFSEITDVLRKMTIDDPSFYEGYIFRLLAHVEIEEYDKALELSNYLENMYPERADVHAFRYHIYTKMGRLQDAEEEKKKVKEIDSSFKII